MTTGITSIEAQRLQEEYGFNSIENQNTTSWVRKIVDQIANFLIILLFLAAGLSFIIGDVLDGSLIIVIIIINAGFGIFQELKAEQAVSALRKLSVTSVRVIRDGKEQEIDSKYLVPGDCVILEEGAKIPADAKIIESHNLEVNEAALTGESYAVVKNKDDMLYMGTIVSKGRAQATIITIGMKTQFGAIAEKLTSIENLQTPLQKKLARLTEVVGLVGIIASLFVFVLSTLQGHGTFPSLLLAISLAVAVVPESLPAVMTAILSIGVKHMAKRNVIIRKLSAIEALGNTTLIATDKTGTLTENKMNVKEVWVDNKVSTPHFPEKRESKAEKLLLTNGVICSTASLVETYSSDKNRTEGEFDVLGDPTEGALLMLARENSLDERTLRDTWELKDEIPFDSIRKRMSVLVKSKNSTSSEFVFSKGAPESILHISSHILVDGTVLNLTEERKNAMNEVLQNWSEHGLRVLAFAYQDNEHIAKIFHSLQKEQRPEYTQDSSLQNNGMVFLGMVAIHDSPRKEIFAALENAESAGIKVVMITGDNEKTAESIGTSIGLLKKGEAIMTGEQIDSYSDEELLEILPHTRIFARTTPFHKSRIVSLYQLLGEIVTVTGDGVNDAVALKQADVGVAMGKVGTDVARESADMVILDDNFATIINAIEEGRNIVVRLKNAIKYLLTGNLTEGLVLVVGLALGFPPLLLPIQLLYINLISDGVPALAMAFSPKNSHIMKQKQDITVSLLKRGEMGYVAFVGVLAAGIVLLVYSIFGMRVGISGVYAQTAAFTMLAMIQAFIFIDIWFAHQSEKKLSLLMPPIFFITVAIPIGIQYLIVRTSFLSELFHTQVLRREEFGMYLVFSLMILPTIWIIRMAKRRL